MRTEYEILLMLDPELPDERSEEILQRARELVEKNGGSWDGHEPWGRRKLAYEITHKDRGRVSPVRAHRRAGDARRDLARPQDHRRRHATHGGPARAAQSRTAGSAAAARRQVNRETCRMSRSRSRRPWTSRRRKSMANINRVVLVGNLTRDPELRHTPSGTSVCKLRLAVNTPPEGRRHRRVGREAELLRRHRLGQPGRELREVPLEGPARRGRRPPRLARVGSAGRHQATGGRGDRRHGPVPRQPRGRWRRRRRRR